VLYKNNTTPVPLDKFTILRYNVPMMNETRMKVYKDLRIKLKLYTDPAHGWVAVKRKLLTEYGIAEHISPYSYQKGDTVYLEEDSDALKFTTKLAAQGIVIEWVRKNTDKRSVIRSYDRYQVK
jgi:hypothetical protein